MAQGMGLGSLGSPAPVFHNFGPSRSSSLSSSSLSHNRHRARSTASNLSAHTGSASASDWSGLGMQDDDSGSCPSPNSFLGNQDFGSPRLGWFSGSQGSASPDPLVSQVQSLSTELGNVKASLSPLHSKVDQLLELLRNPRDPKHAVWILEAGDAFRRQPRIAPGSPQLTELQAQYPSVEIWDPEDFNDKDDVRRVSKGGGTDKKNDINNSGRYIEHTHGGVIGGKELGEINASLNLLLNDVHTAGKSTPRLRHMGHEVMGAIIFMLENEYPYLGLCSNHWKAKRVISTRYRHWARAQGLIGENEGSDGGSDDERMVGTKHKPRAGTAPARKRTKANNASSSSEFLHRPDPNLPLHQIQPHCKPPPPALEPPANSAPQLPPVSAPPPNPTPPLAPAIAPPPSAFIPPPTPAIAPPPPTPPIAPPPPTPAVAPPPPNPVVAPPPSSAFTAPLNPAFAPPPNPPVAPPPNSVVARQYTPGPAFMSAFPPNSGFAFAPPPNPVVAPPPSSAFTAPPNPAVAPPPNTPSSLPLDLGFAPPPHGVITPPNTITTPPPNPALAPPNTAMAPPPNPAPTAVPLADEEPDLFADIVVPPPPAPPATTTTPAPAPIVSKAGGKEASPNPTMLTARNLCLAVWCAEVGGPIASFNIHWDGIKKDKKLFQAYESYARSLKKSSAETIPEVGVIRNTVGLPLATNTPASSSAPQGGTGMGRE
ncbi:hypothetical protein R3P38DRAFT_3177178 [Favolaschia claudopus]|uniref:Uncharacterized protein n=1 Tax=Favolaschia claudopus TaxID=2862362 RepID=A0AAW0D0N6_9AGAR